MALGAAHVAPLMAHHSAAAYYDIKKTVTITGTTSRILWRNPHVFFFVDVKDASGHVSTWSLESQSPDALVRLGLRKDDVKAGDRVTVDVMPAIVSPNRGRVRVLRFHGRSFVDFGPADAPQ
jgi:Family of unknown function (DUF6152)